MRFIPSKKIKDGANTALRFGTLYLAGGLLVNAFGPILGSIYGYLITKTGRTSKNHAAYIEDGHKIAMLYFFPLTATYDKFKQIKQLNQEEPTCSGPSTPKV